MQTNLNTALNYLYSCDITNHFSTDDAHIFWSCTEEQLLIFVSHAKDATHSDNCDIAKTIAQMINTHIESELFCEFKNDNYKYIQSDNSSNFRETVHYINTLIYNHNWEPREINRFIEENISKSVANKTFKSAIEQSIEKLLPDSPTQEKVARELCMSTRKLQRKLKSESLCYQSILDDIRFRRAKHLILIKRLSLYQVAFELGFSSQASFTRSFKRWTGYNPKNLLPNHQAPVHLLPPLEKAAGE